MSCKFPMSSIFMPYFVYRRDWHEVLIIKLLRLKDCTYVLDSYDYFKIHNKVITFFAICSESLKINVYVQCCGPHCIVSCIKFQTHLLAWHIWLQWYLAQLTRIPSNENHFVETQMDRDALRYPDVFRIFYLENISILHKKLGYKFFSCLRAKSIKWLGF